MNQSNVGIVTSFGMVEDDEGLPVLRATVDFYDGASPGVSFKTVWDRTPVAIVEIAAIDAEERGNGHR